jgi:dolichyl-phosphate beta-glucosyltransferase
MMEDTIRHLESSTASSLSKGRAKTVANGSAKANGKSTGATQRKTSSNAAVSKRTVEIIIVDDGSTDKTSSVALDLAKKYASYNIRVVTLEKNIGKGGAVRHGMLYSSGERLLMADADGASRIDDLEALWTTMDELSGEHNRPAVVVGSRAHLVKTEAVVKVCQFIAHPVLAP